MIKPHYNSVKTNENRKILRLSFEKTECRSLDVLRTTLEQWRMFQAVADAGGFNQAAELIHKSQSTIHHGVTKLEQSLGLALFEAHGRRVQLTEAGKVMYRRASYVLNEAGKVEALAGILAQDLESDLALAVDHAFPAELLYSSVDRVAAEYPHLCVHIHETVLSGANERLLDGSAVLAISPVPLAQSFYNELTQVSFIAVAHPQHALHQQSASLQQEQLKSHRQIVTRDSGKSAPTNAGWLGAEQRWTVDHLRTSVDLVARGLGFAWLPEHLISAELAAGRLAPLPLAAGAERRVSFYLNVLDTDKLGPAARALTDELQTRCRELFEEIE